MISLMLVVSVVTVYVLLAARASRERKSKVASLILIAVCAIAIVPLGVILAQMNCSLFLIRCTLLICCVCLALLVTSMLFSRSLLNFVAIAFFIYAIVEFLWIPRFNNILTINSKYTVEAVP